MKTLFMIASLLIGLAVMAGCNQNNDSDNPQGPEAAGTSQIFLVWAEHFTAYNYNALSKTNSDSSITSAYGVILAQKLPQFNYAKINDYTYTGYEIYPGYIGFGDEFSREEQNPHYGALNPLNFEAKTSIGTVSGSVTLPDTIVSFQSSVSDSLPKGHSFTIMWNGSNADFYDVSGEYEWLDANHDWHYIDLDTMVSASSVTYDGSLFQYDGKIRIYDITPTNGPLPAVGAEANLSGEGTGFLYYGNNRKDIDFSIEVGSGLNWQALAKAPQRRHAKDSAAKLAKVRNMLGL